MKLFLVHCGFYDLEVLGGVYEHHVDFMIAAIDFEDARAKVKLEPDFKKRKMHVDGMQMIEAAQGYRVQLKLDSKLKGQSEFTSSRHRDLAPKPSTPPAE